MAESHVLSALKDKRALVAGEIIASERRIGELRAALVHLDGAMRLFAGNDINPEAIPARLPKPAGLPLALPRGDMSRAVLEALRGATGGLSLQSATHMVATALPAFAYASRVEQIDNICHMFPYCSYCEVLR